jgi:lysophospholipase L1-like esterase
MSKLEILYSKDVENGAAGTSQRVEDRILLDMSSVRALNALRNFNDVRWAGASSAINPDFMLVADTVATPGTPKSKSSAAVGHEPSAAVGQESAADNHKTIPFLKLPHFDAAELKKLALQGHAPATITDWDSKHTALVAKASQTDSKLQFFGDSITEYMGNGNLDAFDKNFAWLKPTNFGIASDTTVGLFRRVNDGELGGHPKVVSLMIGTNDIPTAKTPDEIAQNIAKIVETIRLHEPETKVLIMGLLPRCSARDPNREKFREKINQVNAEISQLANGNTIRYLNIGAKFEDSRGFARHDLLPDYLHPSHAGYEVWSDAIKPVIKSMTK